MTVGELIKELEKHPINMEVRMIDLYHDIFEGRKHTITRYDKDCKKSNEYILILK